MHFSYSSATYRAHTNIALIKYWGKRNPVLFLPMTNSLSLTLDAFYTDTSVIVDKDSSTDQFWLNGQQQSAQETAKISRFVDLFRQQADISYGVKIKSQNHVPTAAGLASSASAFAALGLALNDAFHLMMDRKVLSTFVRQGSGSATRSLFGGFVEWYRGNNDDSASSYSQQIDDAKTWDIHMLVIVINATNKKISSRQGMQMTMDTSPFYKLWPKTVEEDLSIMHQAIKNHDFILLGETAEHNAMKMHATTLAANPSFTYWQTESLLAIHIIQNLRREGIPAYVTMDAGPNVKVIIQADYITLVKKRLTEHFKAEQLILCSPGPDPIKLTEEVSL